MTNVIYSKFGEHGRFRSRGKWGRFRFRGKENMKYTDLEVTRHVRIRFRGERV